MKYSSEVKVGITLVVATLIFILGIRYFQDLPLFGKTNVYTVDFNNASGLIAGNAVRINGVSVGAVKDVFFNPATRKARVEFHISGDVTLREGTYARVSGFSALGVVKLDVYLGGPDGPVLPAGSQIEGLESPDFMAEISDTAPELFDRADSVLIALNQVLGHTNTMLSDPTSKVQRSLGSVESIVSGLDESLKADRGIIRDILLNLRSITENVDSLSGGNTDSLAVLLENINASVRQMDHALASVDLMATNLAEVVGKINNGEGTLGLMVNDAGMYERMDSVLFNLNAVLRSFNENPGRFMKEMHLIDVF